MTWGCSPTVLGRGQSSPPKKKLTRLPFPWQGSTLTARSTAVPKSGCGVPTAHPPPLAEGEVPAPTGRQSPTDSAVPSAGAQHPPGAAQPPPPCHAGPAGQEVAVRGDSKAKPPTSSGHVSQQWEGRGVGGPCIPPHLQGASTHRSPSLSCDTPHKLPLLLQSPSTGHPKTPLECPGATAARRRAMDGIKTLPMGPLHPASPPQIGCRPGPARSPPSPRHGRGARAELGSWRGWELCAPAPRGRQHPGSPPRAWPIAPPIAGLYPRGAGWGPASPLLPRCPSLSRFPLSSTLPFTILLSLLYLADQN
ncbi:nascent polypeptide-associated complex subunit alpha, muscle-specific form-like isoform X1 [Aquila chrysaetos chrysaetos]|uniref:nascent polypeptide-associated complex subunit alpha, muscle-specific form-like isoform X1 n=1 Tax=Aquila chrysaetos chrysaetos TaxID=223781 RepID=UPI001176EFBE|nr:nascent polypeptide-associated complex subunit alpha, muscle-specific form-like isoform X1 [Aquila chrysaetos chrysaetos]